MYSNPLNSLQDAYDAIRRYALESVDFEGGTAEGFALWLFVPGNPLQDVRDLAKQLKDYKADFASHARQGGNLDEQLREDAGDLLNSLARNNKERLALAEYIRSVKFGLNGSHLWNVIADLATTPRREGRLIFGDAVVSADSIEKVLEALQQHRYGVDEAQGNDYRPGEDTEADRFVRLDVVRIDESLLSAPLWDGKEPTISLELAALFNLVKSHKDGKLEAELEGAVVH